MSAGVRRIRPEACIEGAATPGMVREEAIATVGMWAGLVRTAPGMLSGWHHHGSFESTIYVMTGALRMEFGPGGAETLETGPGDFLYVRGQPGTDPATGEPAGAALAEQARQSMRNVEAVLRAGGSRPELVVNVTREKQKTNIRTHAADDAIKLVPPRDLTIESAIEFIADDELVEVTPRHLRLRKRLLQESERRRAGKR